MTVEKASPKDFVQLRQAAEKILAKRKGRKRDTDDQELQRILHELEVHHIELDLQNEELRRAVSELETARNDYADLFHSAPVGFLTLTKEGIIERYNQVANDLLPDLAQYPQNTPFSEFIYPEDLPKYFETIRNIDGSAGKGTAQKIELRLNPFPDLPLWVRLDIAAEFTRGHVTRWRLSILDISARIQADKSLRESEEKFRLSFANAAIGFAMTTLEGGFLEANPAYCSMTGYTLQELRSMMCQQLIHPDDLAENRELIEKLCSNLIPSFTIENRYIRKDRSIVHVRKSVSLITEIGGIRQWIVGLTEDITELNRVVEELNARERRFRALTEKTNEFIAVVNDQGIINYITIGLATKLHHKSEELMGRNVFELVHPDDISLYQNMFKDSISRPRETKQIELRIRDGDGSWCWMLVLSTNLQDDPDVEGIVVNGLDISDRKQSEKALQQIRLDLDRAQKVGQIGSWRLDLRQDILKWSKENYRIFGVPEGEPQTYEKFLGAVHPDDCEYVDARWQAALHGEPYDIEHRILTGDQVKWVREKAFLEFDDKGALVSGFGITQDITKYKEIEAELKLSHEKLEERVIKRTDKLSNAVKTLHKRSKQLKKMAAELTLAEQHERHRIASILHDGLQQLLVGAQFQLQILEKDQDLTQGIRPLKEILQEAIDASRSLAMELHPPVLIKNDLYVALRWLADWMWKMHGLRVRLKCTENQQGLNHELFLFIFQSVRELLFNIVKHARVKRAYVELSRLDEQILLTVVDKGRGFDPDTLLLEKGLSKGSGLFGMRERLSIFSVRTEIESTPGKGSRIRFLIPMPAPTKKPVQASSIEQAPDDREVIPDRDSKVADTDGSIRILLVDDQNMVRRGIANLIGRESDFLIVGEASNGKAAVSLARKVQPDVVLMDINMPIMNGIRATQIIHKEMAGIQIIGLSIFDDEFRKKDMLDAGATACFTKRGEVKKLFEIIRSCVRAVSS